MNFRTKHYLRKSFSDYYQNSRLNLPLDFTRREWGFIFFDELPEVVMRRHKAFSSEGEVLEYLRGMVPAHAYHSAAYYEFPGAMTMKDKKWQGADLIFDLDADHLPGKAHSYKEMLDNVKAETEKLLDFILEDFGFSENNIKITFSGGRGYHIHVHDPKVLTLESAQRREIVDYLTGTGLKSENFFEPERRVVYETGKFKKTEIESSRRISSFDENMEGFGWGKRISLYLIHFLKEISTKNDADAVNEIEKLIKNYNLKHASINKFPEEIVNWVIKLKNENKKIGLQKIAAEVGFSEEMVRDILILNGFWDFRREANVKLRQIQKLSKKPNAMEMIEKGRIDFPDITYIFEAIINQAVQDSIVHLGAGHTDEPVTADIRRLIRMPSSLHGGSGMRVVPLTLADFKKFQPLSDAVVFGEKETKIEVIPPLKPQNSCIEMKGKSFTVKEGINNLPEYAAIYLMCRGAAEYA
ncbi:MAG: DNA primase catalytic subunit PriS [Candidatus Methanoperedens sp.]|nr:DNA primase catalytic subunit PriS [Candidatus Methanoperedens sp.]